MFIYKNIPNKQVLNCSICKIKVSSINSLGKHVFHSHKNISRENYYNTFIKKQLPKCQCGNQKTFRGLGEGYRSFCSVKCRDIYTTKTSYWLGKKQNQKTINKRINNTNQKQKEKTRKNTILLKTNGLYNNIAQIPEIKRKISISNKKAYQNGTRDSITVMMNNSRPKFKRGKYKGIKYRSSYELVFLKHCFKNNIKVVSAETKEFRMPYIKNNERHFYYPDFYLPKTDTIVEIKPKQLIKLHQYKINEAKKYYKNYQLITEDDLF